MISNNELRIFSDKEKGKPTLNLISLFRSSFVTLTLSSKFLALSKLFLILLISFPFAIL